jgi:hypothetical protein
VIAETPYGSASSGDDGSQVNGTRSQLYAWAHRAGAAWPCSQLAKFDEVTATFDARGDLVDLVTVDIDQPGREDDIPADELNAWTSDVLTTARLEELRARLDAEDISYGELAELQGLVDE